MIEFVFSFKFFETDSYEKPIDFSTKKAAVGNILYGQVSVVFFGIELLTKL